MFVYNTRYKTAPKIQQKAQHQNTKFIKIVNKS